jgi:hypothetical protein
MGKKTFWRAHCMCCDYITSNKYKWNRHLNTEKHKLKKEVWLAEQREIAAFKHLKESYLDRVAEQKSIQAQQESQIAQLKTRINQFTQK